MFPEVGLHERAHGDDPESGSVRVIDGGLHEYVADLATTYRRRHCGVDKHERVSGAFVFQHRCLAVDRDFESRLVAIVDDVAHVRRRGNVNAGLNGIRGRVAGWKGLLERLIEVIVATGCSHIALLSSIVRERSCIFVVSSAIVTAATVTRRLGIRSMARRNWRNGMETTAQSAPSPSHERDTLAAEATVRTLMSMDLAGDPARELTMIAIEYPPGNVDPVHTHHAQALVYVLEGTVVMQVKGGAAVTLVPGD